MGNRFSWTEAKDLGSTLKDKPDYRQIQKCYGMWTSIKEFMLPLDFLKLWQLNMYFYTGGIGRVQCSLKMLKMQEFTNNYILTRAGCIN